MIKKLVKVYKYGIFLCTILLFAFECYGQNIISPEVINYPKSVYGAESQNWSVTQDEKNILFFGNNKGLLVFNGEEWNLYYLPKQKILRSVTTDGKGKIYTGAFGEFGYWQKEPNGNYKYTSLDSLVKDPLFKEEEIWKINVLQNEVFFQSFSRIHILRNNKVKSIPAPGTVMFAFPVRGRLYAGVLGKGIYTFDDNDNFVPLTADKTVDNYKVTFILPYGNNEMLIGTDKNGMYIFDGVNYRQFATEDNALFITNEINNAVQLDENLYAIGTISGGVFFINTQGKFFGNVNRNSGLQNNTVLNIYKSNDGNCWIGLDKGIAQLILNSDVQYFRDAEGTIGTVYSIALFNKQIFVATNHGLYYAPFTSLADFHENTLKRFGNIANQVWNLKVVDGQLFCSYNSGTAVISADNTSHVLTDYTGSLDLEQLPYNHNILLQGTYYGIAVYRKENNEWKFSGIMSGTGNMVIKKLRADKRTGLIWINLPYKGIYVVKADADYNKAIEIKEISSAGNAPGNTALSFFDNDGKLYVNGKSGIYDYDFAHNVLKPSDSLKNAFGSFFYSQTIIPDSTKGFWFINSDNAVTYKNNRTGEVKTIGFNSNLFELMYGFENILPYTSTQSFIGGEDGFAVTDRSKSKESQSPVAPQITKIQVYEKGKYIYADSSLFDGSDRLALPYSKNSILLHFSSVTYDKNVEYSTSLTLNNDPEWSEWTHTASKEFSNLSAGKYVFRLKSNISDDITTIYIYVNNPWYWSDIAKFIYVLFCVLIIYLLIKWHRRRLTTQHLQLTQKMNEEIKLQKQKNENEILLLKQSQLSEEVVHKSEDLAKLAMDLIKKKNILKKLKNSLDDLKMNNNSEELHSNIQKLSKSLDKHLKDEENEHRLFDNGFNKVHEEFFNRLLKSYPDLTAQDLRLAAYLKMNLSTKEIAPLLNISTRGVEIKRYRLRKKLSLQENDNLNDFMLKF